ncbi:TPA: hypothetical protein EYP66_03940 [Candidatus Poribacteria bacterium]|nr:hypothetical protein [Candidatus Poribacteria bacterium]
MSNIIDNRKPANVEHLNEDGMAVQGRAKLMNTKPQAVQCISLKQLRAYSLEPDIHALVKDAKRQLLEAEREATSILEEARKQAEGLKNEAVEKGYQEGFAQGEKAGKIKVQEENDSLRKVLENAIEEVSALKSSILKDMEAEIIKLTLMLAEKLLLNSLEIHPEAVANIIKNLIQGVQDEEEIKILVNPSILPLLEEYQHQFIDLIKSSGKLKIEGDEKISEGGCLIVTDTKILDAQIETRILEAAKTLLG